MNVFRGMDIASLIEGFAVCIFLAVWFGYWIATP
jgi:hypothetical protein